MSERTKSLERVAEGARAAMSDSLDRAEERLQEIVDWRSRVRRHPMAAMGAAFAVGVLASGALTGRGNDRQRPRRQGVVNEYLPLARQGLDRSTRNLITSTATLIATRYAQRALRRVVRSMLSSQRATRRPSRKGEGVSSRA